MTIFKFRSYRLFLVSWLEARPKKGRGELTRMAGILGVHSTMMSHVLSGKAQLSLEQATELAQYIGLSDLETDYFLELVQLARAGSHLLKNRIEARIAVLQQRALQIKERLATAENSISEEEKGIYYSSWHYSAIRLLATLKAVDEHDVCTMLNLSLKQAHEAIEFLVRTGLCIRGEGSRITAGQSIKHLSADSPFIWKHHQSWRIKAMERYHNLSAEELMYSSPLTISIADMASFREKIVKLIEDLKKTVQKTEPEALVCLNIDWVKVGK